MAQFVHLAVRTVHVLAVALLFGATAWTWAAVRADVAAPTAIAVRYERLFWAAVGLAVLTGVGNLGALGPPGPATRWGRTLTVKLLLVTALLVGSIVRSLAVGRLAGADVSRAVERAFVRRSCAATGWTLAALVVLAEVLAHG